ncbi:GSCOCG00011225001-RA-CDS [Cotesia congregata]|nr:GSCOCG00011225001-RA-CDS [Cotesia congregata]
MLIKTANDKIQTEIKKEIENHWQKILNKIDHKNPEKFFRTINKIFRPKPRQEIPTITIKKTDIPLITRSQCKTNQAIDQDQEYGIQDQIDKLNVIGAYYETINSPRYLNKNTRLKEMIDQKINTFAPKVYEAIINNRINIHCLNNSIIPDNQFGFKRRHSTTHAIHKLLSDVNKHLANYQMVGATLIDLEKAFDSVWIFGLIYILIKKNFKPN